jgi:LuxR family transcriptional regulator, maltose regulon positive regulatory protein
MGRKQTSLAKISRPRLHDVLPRTRLFGLLDEACSRPVVWLCAQPGAGKTTLIASYLEQRRQPGIWYQVDTADADPASFIYHLRLAALPGTKGPGGSPTATLPLLAPEYLQDLRGFARRFFRDLFAQLEADSVLVLDNFQDIPDESASHLVWSEALQQIPPTVNVIVLSRAEPPPSCAALLASGAIAVLDAEQLRLTLSETQAIAARRGVTGDAQTQELHSLCNGWAAGLTLMLIRTRGEAAAQEADDAPSMQHVFGYFAQRVFDDAPAEHRHALMQLALLPSMTVQLAEQLTGSADAGRLLDLYYRRHLFTDRRRVATAAPGAAAPTTQLFQFHALFRSFLQHQARSAWSAAEMRDALGRAALLLDAAGQWEPALELFAQAGDWGAYAKLLAAHAEGLLEQGRRQTVTDGLARMPQAARESDIWLRYWEGRASMQSAPGHALKIFEACHQSFAAAQDLAGQLASGAALVQTLWYARLGWSEIAPWVDWLEPLMASGANYPSRTMELMSTSALHAALAFCRIAHPLLPGMARQLLGLVDDAGIDWNQRLSTATHLITYFHNAAEHDLATQLIAKVDAAVEALPSSALNRSFWFIFRAIHDLRQAKHDEASTRFQRAEDLARQDGLAHAEFAAIQFHAYLDVVFGKADQARRRVARLEVHPARGNPDAEMNFAVVQTLLAQLDGDVKAALGHAQRAQAAIARVGAEYFQVVFPALLASAFADAGQPEHALEIIANSRRLSRGSYLEAMDAQFLLEEAYIALVQGDAKFAHEKLAQGLALAAADRTRAANAHRIVARKPVLLVTALKAGIEVEFVRRLIRNWRVAPPAEDIAAWPWPVRVRTLGGFEVQVHDTPIEFGRKAPKKTLALLKAIIARGGAAHENVLIDTFWSDEEGDAAARSLGAAVHRLRGLLGVADAVVQQGGQISLDRAMVWVDAWAFERGLGAARGSSSEKDAALGAALTLYRGAFLAEEEGEPWPVAMRERLRNKFVQAVAEHAARLEAEPRIEEAIRWYQRGLDADSVVEPFYQGLMRCYHRLDRLPEAVSAYRRLKQTLSVLLSLPPSAGTEKLYQALRLESAQPPPAHRPPATRSNAPHPAPR